MWSLCSYPKINLYHRNFEVFAVPVTVGPRLEVLARNCLSVAVQLMGLKADQSDVHNLEKQFYARLFMLLFPKSYDGQQNFKSS